MKMKNYYIAIILFFAIIIIVSVASAASSTSPATGRAISVAGNLGDEITLELGKTASVGEYEITLLNRALDAPEVATISVCKGMECKTASTMRAGKSTEFVISEKNLKLEVKDVVQRKSATFILTDLAAPPKTEEVAKPTEQPTEQPKEEVKEDVKQPEEKPAAPNIFEALINWFKSLFGWA